MSSRLRQGALGAALLATVLIPPVLTLGVLTVAGQASVRLVGEYHNRIGHVVELVQDNLAETWDIATLSESAAQPSAREPLPQPALSA